MAWKMLKKLFIDYIAKKSESLYYLYKEGILLLSAFENNINNDDQIMYQLQEIVYAFCL